MSQKKKKSGLFHHKKQGKKTGSAGTRAPSQQSQPQQQPRRKPVLFDQDAPVTRRPAQSEQPRRMEETYWTPPKAPEADKPSRPAEKKKAAAPVKKAVKKPALKKKPLLSKKKKNSSRPSASLEDIKRNANQSAEQADSQEALREQKKKETGKRSQRKRRRMSAFYYIMLILFVLGVGVTLCLTVFFRIETVGVEGHGRYSSQQIRDAAGIEVGDNLLMIDADKAAKKVESLLPFAENVKIEKRLPSVVTISYEEASEAIALEGEDRLVVLRALYKVRGLADEAPAGAIRVRGIRLGECAEGAQAVFADGQEEALFREVADCIRETGFTGLTEFDFSEPGNLRARFEDRITIVFGTQQDLAAKLNLAQGVLSEKVGPNEKGTLTVSAVPRANFLPDYSTEDDSSAEEEPPESSEVPPEEASSGPDASGEDVSTPESAA